MGTFLQDMASAAPRSYARQTARKPKKKESGGGWFDDLVGGVREIGNDISPELGLGNAGAALLGLGPAVWHLGTDVVTKGPERAWEETYHPFLEGSGKSFLNTVSTLAKPIGGDAWFDKGWENVAGYHPQDFFERARDKNVGILPALIEDVGNVAIAGAVAGKALKAGEVGTLGAEAAAREAALEAPGSASAASRLAKAEGRASGLHKAAQDRFAVSGEGVAEQVPGRALPSAERVASRASKIRKADIAAHPYQAAFNRVIRPVTSLADAAGRAGAAAEAGVVRAAEPGVVGARRTVAGSERGGVVEPEAAVQNLRDTVQARNVEAVAASRTRAPEVAHAADSAPPERVAAYAAENPDLALAPELVQHSGDYDEALMGQVADQYDAPDFDQPTNPEVRAQYLGGTPEHPVGFLEQIKRQYLRLTRPVEEGGDGIAVEFHGPNEPEYRDYAEMNADIATNARLRVRDTASHGDSPNKFMAQADPKTGLTYNDMFRAVHDAYGHSRANDFGRAGELTAFREHSQWFSRDVDGALANETIGQTASLVRGPEGVFPPQKTGLIDPKLVEHARTGINPDAPPIKSLDTAPLRPMPVIEGRQGPIEGVRPTESPAAQTIAARAAARVAQAPGWSKALVERLPQPVVEVLASVEHFIQAREVNTVAREMSRIVEASRRQAIADPAVQIAVEQVAKPLVGKELDDGTIISRVLAGEIVGAELQARLTGVKMLARAGDDPILTEAINRVASQGKQIPQRLIDELGLEEPLELAAAEWTRLSNERVATLAGGRLGAEGLADIGEDVPTMTKREAKAWRKLERLMQERAKWEARAERQVGRIPGEIERIDTSIDKVIEGAARDQAQATQAAQTVRRLYEQHPFGDDPALRDSSLAKAADSTIENGGATLDTVSGDLITDSTYGVAIRKGTMRQVTAERFAQEGPTILGEVIDGDHIFRDGRVRLGTWKHALDEDTVIDGELVPAGTEVVDIDPSIDSWSADPSNPKSQYRRLSKQQAIIIGKSLGQDSIWDFAADTDIPTKVDPRVAALHSSFVDLALNPRSRFSGYMNDLQGVYDDAARVQGGVGNNLHPDDIAAQLQADMVMAYGWARAHGKVSPDGRPTRAGLDEFFSHKRAEFSDAKNPRVNIRNGFEDWSGTELNQVMLDLDIEDPNFGEWVRANTPNAEARAQWYTRSHDGVERAFRGKEVTLGDGTVIDAADLMYQVIAVTSIQADPVSNLGHALAALGNWKEFQASGGAALKQYQRNMAKFLRLAPAERTHTALVETLMEGIAPKQRNASEVVEAIATGTGKNANQGVHRRALTAILSGHTLDKWSAQDIMDLNVPYGGKRKGSVNPEKTLAAIDPDTWDRAREEVAALNGGALDEAQVEARALALHLGSRGWAKILSFWQNLADPANSQAVTLDSWMARAFGIKDWDTPGGYIAYSRRIAEAAAQAGMPPHALQALIWTYAKKEIGRLTAARTFGATTAANDLLAAGARLGTPDDPILQMFDFELSKPGELAGQDASPTGKKFGVDEITVPTAEQHGGAVGETTMAFARKTAADDIAKLTKQRQTYVDLTEEMNRKVAEGDVQGAQRDLAVWAAERTKKDKVNTNAGDFSDFFSHPTDRVLGHGGRAGLWDLLDQGELNLADEVGGRITGFTRVNDQAQKMLMRFYSGADISTLVHENMHVLRQIMTPEDVSTLERALGAPGIFRIPLNDPIYMPGRRAAEELFVKEFMTHLLSGRAQSPALQPVLDRLQEALRNQHTVANRYGNLTVQQPEELAAIWDKYLDPELPEEQIANDLGLMGRESARTADATLTPEQLAAQNRPLPGESAADATRRQRTMSRALETKHFKEHRGTERIRRVARLQKAKAEMEQVLRDGTVPAQAEVERLGRKIEKAGAKLEKSLLDPKTSQINPVWQPMKQTLDKLWEEAADDPALAEAMQGLPKTFGEILVLAKQRGFDPTHVRSFTPGQVERLVHETIRLGQPGRSAGEEIVAGTRKPRVSGIPRTQSMDALIAATVEATHEVQTNELVTFIEENFAQPYEGAIPKGYEAWDPVKRGFTNREEVLPSGKNVTRSPEPTAVIPTSVARTLRQMGKSYNHQAFRVLGKPSSWWRTYLLTLTPRWYVNNFVGNFALAEAEGVKLGDWISAWKSYRQRSTRGGPREAAPFSDTPGVTGASVYHELESPTVVPPNTGVRGLLQDMKKQPTKEKWFQVKHRLARGNEVVDELARAAVYHKTLRTTGSAEKALQRSYAALVDYGDLGPMERSMVRAVVPFYAWQKGILKAVTKLGIDHPAAFGIMQRMSDLNREMLQDQYGADVPRSYEGIIGLPGGGALNTRGFNPFADAGQLIRANGIGESINPFVEAIVRNELNAPQFTRPDDYRVNQFGSLVPETNVNADIAETFSAGLPQGQLALTLAGQSPYTTPPSNLQAVERFGGINAMSKEDLQRIIQRMTESEATLAGTKGPAKRKRKPTSTSTLGGPFLRVTGR